MRNGVCMLLLLVGTLPALGQSGKLSGKVTADGEAAIGATVLIQGTTLGAAVDLDGDYAILQISPGTYNVRFSSIGYQTQVINGVRISSNRTTTLDVALTEEVIEGEEVVVTAEKPVVDITLTSSMATLSQEDIEILPVQNLDDIVNLQAGVVDGHFRGGRTGEVQYQVDGVSVNNPFNNESSLKLDRSVLQEVQVIQGTFDAEYGQAMSGVVNAVLRSGDRDRYRFSAEVYVGDYFSPGNDSTTVINRFEGAQEVALFPFIDEVSPKARQNYQLSLSGPVPVLPSTTFLLNVQRFVDQGHLMGQRRFVPTDSADFERQIFNGSGDGALVPMGTSTEWAWLGKLSNYSLSNIQLDYQLITNRIRRLPYSHSFRFNPDGLSTQRQFSIVHGIDWTHTLNNRLFYEMSLRHNYFDFEDFKYEDVRDPRYFLAGQPRGDANFLEGATVQGLDLGRFVQRTNSFLGKGAITSQTTKTHLLKAGFEWQASDLDFGVPGRIEPVVIDGIQQLGVVEDTLGAEVVNFKPVQGALFIQDRMEWQDLRIRAGLRFEYFDANGKIPSDLQNPANAITGAPESRLLDTTVKYALAPRLGVSFPILNRASMFFSYGHFYQLPGLGQMFSNADYTVLRDLQAGAVSFGVLGNPDLDPEFTVQYEFGFKSELTSFLGLDLSLFYKDVRDLLGVEFVQTYTAAEYARLTNIDFGGVRGFTLALDQRRLGNLSSSIDYTFQRAVGNASDPRETANRAAAGEDPRPRQVPFNWDQRHTLNSSIVFSAPNNYAVTGILKFSSGQPYTPSLSTGFGADLEANSGRKPTSVIVDLRAEKFFTLGGLQWTGFLRVLNLLDQHYRNGSVFSDTGSPFYTLLPAQQRDPNPNRLFPPRRIEIGISLRGGIGG